MSYSTQFPSKLTAAMPAIPSDWKDISYGNDVCPSFMAKQLGSLFVRVWIDAVDPDDRELARAKRFTVVLCHDDDLIEPVTLFASEDFAATAAFVDDYQIVVTAEVLAVEFCQELRSTLSAAEMEVVRERNALEGNSSVCHSHDVCDANQVMIAALARFTMEFDASDDMQGALIEQAWDCAKAAGFDADLV